MLAVRQSPHPTWFVHCEINCGEYEVFLKTSSNEAVYSWEVVGWGNSESNRFTLNVEPFLSSKVQSNTRLWKLFCKIADKFTSVEECFVGVSRINVKIGRSQTNC